MSSKKLTYKQRQFVEFYVSTNGNAYQPAKHAGYAGSDATLGSIGLQLVAKAPIAIEIEKAEAKQRAAQNLTLDWWRREVYDWYERSVEAGERASSAKFLELAGKRLGAFTAEPESQRTRDWWAWIASQREGLLAAAGESRALSGSVVVDGERLEDAPEQ